MTLLAHVSTRWKMRGAAALSWGIVGLRRLAGRGPLVRVQRHGVAFQLDLQEGIDLAVFLGLYERSTVTALGRLVPPGAVTLDIGANVGVYTLLFAHLAGPAGRVLAFEPTAFAFAKLEENLRANPALAGQVTALRALLVASPDERGPERVASSWPLSGGAPVDPVHRGRLMPVDGAEVLTLDAALARLAPPRVDLVKLDVDGHETAVLLGGLASLAAFRPVLLFEVAPAIQDDAGRGLSSLVDLLARIDYALESVPDGRPLPLSAEALGAMCAAGAGFNAVARPARRR
jgi:FkbM family methyltransferase